MSVGTERPALGVGGGDSVFDGERDQHLLLRRFRACQSSDSGFVEVGVSQDLMGKCRE